ncbi:MAG: hypothetical protein KAT46_07640 [Deltaproteobacteria bacterium]|nr:hypothetical protein [Deltaproteobacteria bacterium]
MKNIICMSLLLVLGLLFVSCSDESTAPEQSEVQNESVVAQHMTEAVSIEAKAVLTSEGRVSVSGESNLPDGTALMVSLIDEKAEGHGQDETSISNGQFTAGPLGAKSGLKPARYVINITMPMPNFQPEHVKKIIGDKGQYLIGSLVRRSDISDSNNVEISFSFNIGSVQEIKETETINQRKRLGLYDSVKLLVEQGRSMQAYRNSDDISLGRKCGEMMHRLQPQAEDIKEKASSLPMRDLSFKSSLWQLSKCVSCRSNALEACDAVSDELVEATQ